MNASIRAILLRKKRKGDRGWVKACSEAKRSPPPAKIKGSRRSEAKFMTVRQPRYSKEEFAQRGDEIYESQVRPQVEEGNHGKIVAIDIETGAFEVDASEIAACDRLEAHYPDAQIWIVRIGSRHVRRFGGRTRRTA
jgi:hypothetical protein